MKKRSKLGLFIGLVTTVAAVITAVTAVLLYLDHKKREEDEMERYLEGAIQ